MPPRIQLLNPPIPALHPERDALLAAVRDADPADDLPALVYADWQDEHGQPEHAELIRLMVELPNTRQKTTKAKARNKKLIARVKELFATPAVAPLKALESNTWRFRRGFVPHLLFRMNESAPASRPAFVRSHHLHDLHERVPFDKLAWLGLVLSHQTTADECVTVAALPWLRRMDTLSLHEWDAGWVSPGTLAPIIASPHLGQVRQFGLGYDGRVGDHEGVIASSEVVRLYLAKSATGLRVFPLADVQRQTTTNTSRRRSAKAFLSAVEPIVSSPRARQFTSLEGHYYPQVDTALARILLGSPHLGGVRKLAYYFARITAKARAAFAERFGLPERV